MIWGTNTFYIKSTFIMLVVTHGILNITNLYYRTHRINNKRELSNPHLKRLLNYEQFLPLL